MLAVRICIVLLSGLFLSGASAAQEQRLSELMIKGDAAPALENEYARAVVDEMTAIVIESSDAACRAASRIDAPTVKERLRHLLLEYTSLEMTRTKALVDSDAYRKALVTHAGANAPASLQRFLSDPAFAQVAEYIRASVLEAMFDLVVTHLDLALVLDGVKLKRKFSPMGAGNEGLLKLQEKRIDELNATLESLRDRLPIKSVEPVFDLVFAHGMSLPEAMRAEVPPLDIRRMVPGVLEKLKALCVGG